MFSVTLSCDACGAEIATAPTKGEAIRLAGPAGNFSPRRLQLYFCSKACRKSDKGKALCQEPMADSVRASDAATKAFADWFASELLQANPSVDPLDDLSPQQLAAMVPWSPKPTKPAKR